jgi:hypothetical protein
MNFYILYYLCLIVLFIYLFLEFRKKGKSFVLFMLIVIIAL